MKAPKFVKAAPLIGGHESKKRHSYTGATKSLGQGSHIAQNAATHIKSTMKRYK